MKRCAVVCVLVLACNSVEAASIRDPNQLFSVLCSPTATVGFKWQNSNWVPTNFNNENYIVEKIRPRGNVNLLCLTLPERETVRPFGSSEACFKVSTVGNPNDVETAKCEEFWLGQDLQTIQCNTPYSQLLLDLDRGPFVLTKMSGAFLPHLDDSRDDVVTALGSCVILGNP